MEEEEEEEEGWEEGLDVDDSDLPSLLPTPPSLRRSSPSPSFPPLRPCSRSSLRSQPLPPEPPHRPAAEEAEAAATVRRRIPGPAGAVQAAMYRQATVAPCRGDSPLRAEGEDRRSFGDRGEEVDEDFLQNPWLRASDFLDGNGSPSLVHPISSIKPFGSSDRVPKLVGIVKSCKQNGLGDLFVTLKDTTGIIGASIHRRVLVEGNFGGDFSVGCVLILKQVVIFAPVRSTAYVNVTLNNVVKIFGKDSRAPSRQILPVMTGKFPASGKKIDGGMEAVVERACFPRQGTELAAADESQMGSPVVLGTVDRVNMEEERSAQICDQEVADNIHCKRIVDGGRAEHHPSGIQAYSGETDVRSVGFGYSSRASFARPDINNIGKERVIQDSNSKRIDDQTVESPSRKLRNSSNVSVIATPLTRSMLESPVRQGADHNVNGQVRGSSGMMTDHGRNIELTGRLDSLNFAAATTSLGRSMRGSLLSPGADLIVTEPVRSSSDVVINHGKSKGPTERLNNRNVTATVTSLGRSVLGSSSRQGAGPIANDQVRSSNNVVMDCGKNEAATGSFPCSPSCASVTNSLLSKPPDRVVEAESVIPKVSVAQWTDEQLSELFCDYQDDADFF